MTSGTPSRKAKGRVASSLSGGCSGYLTKANGTLSGPDSRPGPNQGGRGNAFPSPLSRSPRRPSASTPHVGSPSLVEGGAPLI